MSRYNKKKFPISTQEKARRKKYWIDFRKKHKKLKAFLRRLTKIEKKWYYFWKKKYILLSKQRLKRRLFSNRRFVPSNWPLADRIEFMSSPYWKNRKKWARFFYFGYYFKKLKYFKSIHLFNLKNRPKKINLRKLIFSTFYTFFLRENANRLNFLADKGLLKFFSKLLYKRKKKFQKRFFKFNNFSTISKLVKLRKLKISRVDKLEPYRITIKRIENNVFVYLSEVQTGKVLFCRTAGAVGFKGSKKTTHITAEKVVNVVAKQTLDIDIDRIDLVINATFVDKYIKTAISGLTQAFKLVKPEDKKNSIVKKSFLKVKHILLEYSASHNGMRKPKQRRV